MALNIRGVSHPLCGWEVGRVSHLVGKAPEGGPTTTLGSRLLRNLGMICQVVRVLPFR